MALSREIWAAIEQEFARAIFWSHAWGDRARAAAPHPLAKMEPEKRERLNRRAPRQTFPG